MKVLLAGCSLLFAMTIAWSQPTSESPSGESRYDGVWTTTISCPTHTDGAFAYTYDFPAQIKGGALTAEYRSEDSPPWLRLRGKIQPDGRAILSAQGLTGDPNYAANRVQKATRYAFHVNAQFDEKRGTGQRVETRVCEFTFVKR